MKSFTKFFMVVGLLGLMMNCDYRTEEQRWEDYQAKKERARQDSIREARFKGFHVIEIDSCEYLIKKKTMVRGSHRGFGFGFMSHKGNCKFCEERHKQEKTERENCE